MNGAYWFRNDNWLDYEVSECDWYMGVPTEAEQETYNYKFRGHCDEDGHLILVHFNNNNLTGTGQEAFIWLEFLEYIDCSYNNIAGPIVRTPIMPNLQVLVIAHTQVSGVLYDSGNVVYSSIRVVRLDGNNLYNQISNIWRLYPNIEIFNGTGNEFQVELVPGISDCSKLRYIGVADIALFGSLPSEIGLLTHLYELDVSGNTNLVGTIPSELGLLNNSSFVLDVRDTSINGTIPAEICEGAIQVIADCAVVGCCDAGQH